MRTFGLENVKAFANTGDIELAPITIIVGQNSCGKSSFIRFPVVLSQSNHDNLLSLCLHADREGVIDYGNYEDVLHNHKGQSFSCRMSFSIRRQLTDENVVIPIDFFRDFDIETIHLRLTYSKKQDTGILSCVKYDVDIDGKPAFSFEWLNDYSWLFTQKVSFVGEKPIAIEEKAFKINIANRIFQDDRAFILYEQDNAGIIEAILKTELTDSDEHSLYKLACEISNDSFGGYPDDDPLTGHNKTYANKIHKCLCGFSQLKRNNIVSAVNDFSTLYKMKQHIDKLCKQEIERIHYIGPFRKNPERIYRRDEVTVRDVGKGGENTSKLLINDAIRGSGIIEEVSSWYKQAMGIEVQLISLGHEYYQIQFNELEKQIASNIMDVGFGVSQVLPIVSQIAEARIRAREHSLQDIDETYIIEQPELHLHPAAQSKLADLFAEGVAGDAKYYNKFVIETHSEHLIRALQIKIADPNCALSNQSVKFYYVDKEKDGSVIKEMKTNEYGQFVQRWPKGFFDEAHLKSRELMNAIAERENMKEARYD